MFARAESVDTGKPLALARSLDIPRASSNFRFFATAILHTDNEAHLMDGVAFNYTLRQPRGVVGLISGRMDTGRDAVHAHLMKHEPPVDLSGSVLYHCGPVVKKEGDGWRVTAAGPTTSIREEPYQAEILRRYGVRAVVGKGGMGAKTLQGLKESGAVYLNAIGGAAQLYARCIERVDGVSLTEFGTPEAMWHLEVRDFPAIVTMDAHGNSLHNDVEVESGRVLATLAEK